MFCVRGVSHAHCVFCREMAAAESFGGDCVISDEKVMNLSNSLSDRVNMDTGYIEEARLNDRGITEEVIEDIAEAAKIAKDKQETEAVFEAFNRTPGLNECPIAPDVLVELLPDEDVIVLPKLDHVGGGAFYRFVKRAFDIISCSCALVILAIPMVVIAALIKRQDPGPAIYAQTRVGKDGKLFKVYKFRSMYVDAEARGAQWAQGDDPRVTPLGRKLRSSRFDETPQFVNVIKGDIPLRILKTRRGFSVKMLGAFALPARLARTRIAAFLQVRGAIYAIVGVPQNLFEYSIAGYGKMRGIFAKRDSRIEFPLLGRFMLVPCNGFPI